MVNFRQFFEGDSGQLSMTRLLCFISWFPATGVLLYNVNDSSVIGELLAWYLGSFVLGYVGGKATDVFYSNRHSYQPQPQPNTEYDVNPNNPKLY